MGVLKNDVGRPSKKTKIIRGVLKLIGVLIIIALGLGVGYLIGNNKAEKESNNKIKISSKEAENILKKYSINDDVYSLAAHKFSENYKILLSIKNTKPIHENNICEKVIKQYNLSKIQKDELNNYLINDFFGYDGVYCSDENNFYMYTDVEKQYKKLFGKNDKLSPVEMVDNLGVFELYAYLDNPNGYIQIDAEQGGFYMDGQTHYIYDAYVLNGEMHIIFSTFFYIDLDENKKLNIYFPENVTDDIDNNLSKTNDGKISGDVEEFFIKNKEKIPVYEIILEEENENYIFKYIGLIK